jgi:GDP-mannose 6-dehydrogenase
MKISIFGLGYVGVVSGACIAKLGHRVIGVDVNPVKVRMVDEGKSPIIEKDLPELLQGLADKELFKATENALEAVAQSDISMICVGTPSKTNGNLDLSFIKRVCSEVGGALQHKPTYHLVVVRSTMLPGSIEDTVIPSLEVASGKRTGFDFGVCYNPEFMREGTSIQDFFHPPMTVIGGGREKDIDALAELYREIDAPIIRTSYRVAEVVKYICNAFHALKISFANEIGALCKELVIDSHEVMEIFCIDRKLNISPAYLKPGFAFGGSCLPKDLRALNYKAKELDLNVPLLNSILSANQLHIQRALDSIYRKKKKKVGILGLSFKAGTDDLRESPMVALAETLIGKGFQVKIYDRNISMARLTGSNKEFIEKEIPHISSILVEDIKEILSSSEVIVIGNTEDEFRKVLDEVQPEQIVIDLVRIKNKMDPKLTPYTYEGICW